MVLSTNSGGAIPAGTRAARSGDAAKMLAGSFAPRAGRCRRGTDHPTPPRLRRVRPGEHETRRGGVRSPVAARLSRARRGAAARTRRRGRERGASGAPPGPAPPVLSPGREGWNVSPACVASRSAVLCAAEVPWVSSSNARISASQAPRDVQQVTSAREQPQQEEETGCWLLLALPWGRVESWPLEPTRGTASITRSSKPG